MMINNKNYNGHLDDDNDDIFSVLLLTYAIERKFHICYSWSQIMSNKQRVSLNHVKFISLQRNLKESTLRRTNLHEKEFTLLIEKVDYNVIVITIENKSKRAQHAFISNSSVRHVFQIKILIFLKHNLMY